MSKITLSLIIVSMFTASNALAGKCSNAIGEVSRYDVQEQGYVAAVDMAVDQCIVEAQDKYLPSVVQQIESNIDICIETANEMQLSETFLAQCHLKAVKLSNWILNHRH